MLLSLDKESSLKNSTLLDSLTVRYGRRQWATTYLGNQQPRPGINPFVLTRELSGQFTDIIHIVMSLCQLYVENLVHQLLSHKSCIHRCFSRYKPDSWFGVDRAIT